VTTFAQFDKVAAKVLTQNRKIIDQIEVEASALAP
jgi:hypothetical protein